MNNMVRFCLLPSYTGINFSGFAFSAQLESGLGHVRTVMGDEAMSGLDDGVIKDALWDYYFDVEKALSCLYGVLSSPTSFRAAYAEASDEQERRIAAKERKGRPSLVRSF